MSLIEYLTSVTQNILTNGIQMLHIHAADENLEEDFK